MDRKEFLKVVWSKLFKPILLIGVLIFSVRFLIRIFAQNDIERLISIIVLGFVILSAFSYLFGLVFTNVMNLMKSKLSEKSLDNFRILGKIINYLIPIAIGVVIYYTWQRDGGSAVAFFGAFLIFQIIEIIRKEKLATTRGHKTLGDR